MAVGNHVENPFEFVLEKLSWMAEDVRSALLTPARRHVARTPPVVRRIVAADLWTALRQGAADLGAVRDDVLFIALIYPVAGLVLARLAFSYNLLPLVFPLASGFALIGPLAAIGLYEVSRRREAGEPVSWAAGLSVLRSPAIGSILGLGAILLMLFFAWLAAAWAIYAVTLGPAPPVSLGGFVRDVFETPAGWAMMIVGIGVGFLFAALALAISVVSFPLLLDRDVGIGSALGASLRAVAANPWTMALWGAIVAGGLVLGSLPGLVGLIFVVPVLGHATWHLYRKAIAEP
ncbi:MAG: cytochrome c oxidase subunit [Phenylobacterium sp.]|nr:cytochrome c oxidase subunit [Phenylobacterium sp.]